METHTFTHKNGQDQPQWELQDPLPKTNIESSGEFKGDYLQLYEKVDLGETSPRTWEPLIEKPYSTSLQSGKKNIL